MSNRNKRSVFGEDDRRAAYLFKDSDPKKYRASLAVSKVIFSNGHNSHSGTAWRVSSGNFMITNRHVMHSNNPKDYIIYFSDGFGGDLNVGVSKIIRYNPTLDCVLFQVDESIFNSGVLKKYGFLELDPLGASKGDHIYIPQFGSIGNQGSPKTITISNVDTIDFLQGYLIGYKSDTSLGSSGGPVISILTNKVIGLNHSYNNFYNYATNSSIIWSGINEFLIR